MNALKKLTLLLLVLATLTSALLGCQRPDQPQPPEIDLPTAIDIIGADRVSLTLGDELQLRIDQSEEILSMIKWTATSDCVSVSDSGLVTTNRVGTVLVTATLGELSDKVLITVVDTTNRPESVTLTAEKTTLMIGESTDLIVSVAPAGAASGAIFSVTSGSDVITVQDGRVVAQKEGTATVVATVAGVASEELTITVAPAVDPYEGMSADEFYANYTVADSYLDAYYRTQHGFMSGSLTVPDQAPVLSEYQPMRDGMLIRNRATRYEDDGNTYVVVNAYGQEVMEIYRGAAYITLEEVAAYVFAFGDVPANYSATKKTKPTQSVWGIYLRVNHTQFTGDTSRYPYEPELPNISGCGGDFVYYEIDIGTTGNDCDPAYRPALYNNGVSIIRGASRIVYARFDKNNNHITEPDEKFVFYTYNHYNDFQEYLNYFGGWGEMFGNITGGGVISDKQNCNPTPYVPVWRGDLSEATLQSPTREQNDYVEIVWCLPVEWTERKHA